MFKSKLFLFLTLLVPASCETSLTSGSIAQVLFIWCSFVVVVTFKALCVKFKIPFHHTTVTQMCGFIAAFVIKELNNFENFSILDAFYLNYLYFYLPGTVFEMAFNIDSYVFIKTFSQILVISFPVSILTAAATGIIFQFVVEPHWPYVYSIMFGTCCTVIYSSCTRHYLQRLAVHMKHTSSLLDGESIITTTNCHLLYVLLMGYSVGLVHEWYQYVMVILRLLLLGAICGYFFGLFGRFLIKKLYSDNLGVVMVTFALPYFAFGVTEMYMRGSGTLCVILIGIVMAQERSTFSAESEEVMSIFWRTTEELLTLLICLCTSFKIGYFFAKGLLNPNIWVFTIVIYVIYYTFRSVSFIVFSPIISRLGYGMDMKSMMILIIGGLKNPLCLLYSGLYNRRIDLAVLDDEDKIAFKFYVWALYLFSYILNSTCIPFLLKVMGVSEMSMAKQVNMNNCMKHIFAKRERIINLLKQDRYVSDANWNLVNLATTMRHPDRVYSQTDGDVEDDNYFMGYRYNYCPDCKKDVAEEPTKKELAEMSKEAKMRVLKAIKMSFTRQYENGMVSKEVIKILDQSVELAMDTEEGVLVVEGLHKKFNEENCFKTFVRKKLQNLGKTSETNVKPPRTFWRRWCYNLTKNHIFTHIIFALSFFNIITMIADVTIEIISVAKSFEGKLKEDETRRAVDLAFFFTDFCFFVIYLFEFWVKVMSYSRTSILDGLRIYFQHKWYVVDFVVICVIFLSLMLEGIEETGVFHSNNIVIWWVHIVVDFVKLIRVLKLLELIKVYYPLALHYLDRSVDANMAFTYELGKAYVSGGEEVGKMLPQIVDYNKIKDEIKQRLEQDRVLIIKLLGIVQKERPWIAITVKTKQAIRTINNNMKDAIVGLKTSGWIDSLEYDKLMKVMTDLYKHVNSIKSVQPSPPEVIFKEVSWMAGEDRVFEFLFENVIVKTFDPGDVVFGEGMVADGIYVVVTGLFLLTYTPEPNVLESLEEYGLLPIADYVLSTQYHEVVNDYIVSGNCMGELSTLTGRSFNCTITADAHSQVYVLTSNVIKMAMELSDDSITGLECRIWKAVSVRLALPILMTVPAYQSFSQDQIKYTLESAFMPDLSGFKIFTVTEMIQDIVLIEGVVADFHTRELFLAPCYIPRTVQKLILPNSSLINVPIRVNVQFLIIPEKDVDEIDVMLLAEETCEMVASRSSMKCLHHMIQSKSSRLKRRQRTKAVLDADSSRRRAYTTKSGYAMSTSTGDSMMASFSEKSQRSIAVSLDLEEEEIFKNYKP